MIIRIVRQHALAAALPLFLAACAGIPHDAPEPPPSAGAARSFHQAIELGGRLSVRYQSNGKDEALHGSFAWSQTPEQTIVTLLSPLGQTLALIEATPHGATLKQSGGQSRTAADVNALTASTLGWPLPVSGLRDWLQGFALDANGKRVTATPSTPAITTHDGWHIRYANWDIDNKPGAAAPHPRRIDLARSTEHAGDVSIRIVIDTWQTR